MSRRAKVAVAIGTLVSGLAAASLVAHAIGRSRPDCELLDSAPTAWPLNRAWSWNVSVPPDLRHDEGLALGLRTKSWTMPPGIGQSIGSTDHAMTAAESDHILNTSLICAGGTDTRTQSGTATVQLLDLDEIGITTSRPGSNLRVLCKLNIGGSEGSLGGDEIVLPAGHIGGTEIRSDAHWANGELYLMSFFVQNGQTISWYDVFVARERAPS